MSRNPSPDTRESLKTFIATTKTPEVIDQDLAMLGPAIAAARLFVAPAGTIDASSARLKKLNGLTLATLQPPEAAGVLILERPIDMNIDGQLIDFCHLVSWIPASTANNSPRMLFVCWLDLDRAPRETLRTIFPEFSPRDIERVRRSGGGFAPTACSSFDVNDPLESHDVQADDTKFTTLEATENSSRARLNLATTFGAIWDAINSNGVSEEQVDKSTATYCRKAGLSNANPHRLRPKRDNQPAHPALKLRRHTSSAKTDQPYDPSPSLTLTRDDSESVRAKVGRQVVEAWENLPKLTLSLADELSPSKALETHALLKMTVAEDFVKSLLDAVAEYQNRISPPIGRTIANHISVGRTFHVATSVVDLVHSRAASLEGTSTTADYPPPCPCGVMVFDAPIARAVADESTDLTHMVSWGPATFEIPLPHDHPDEPTSTTAHGTVVTMWADMGRLKDRYGQSISNLSKHPDWDRIKRLTNGLFATQILPFTSDMKIGPQRWTDLSEDGRHLDTTSPLRKIMAIWQLMAETIVDTREERPVHHIRTLAKRNRIKPRITVITLRRKVPTAETGTGRPLDHRVPVNGHWRDQPYGPGRALTKRIWIGDHWRGPEDAPIVQSEKVYDLRR